MSWRDGVSAFAVAASWALYLGGLDELPAWEGFGKGMAVGSLRPAGPLAVRLVRRVRNPRPPFPGGRGHV